MYNNKLLDFSLKLMAIVVVLQGSGCKKPTDLDAIIEQGLWNIDSYQITYEKIDNYVYTGQPVIGKYENIGQLYIADTIMQYGINTAGGFEYKGLIMKYIINNANLDTLGFLNTIAFLQGDKLRQSEITVYRDPSGAALQKWYNVRLEEINTPGFPPTFAYYTSVTDGPGLYYEVLFRKLSKSKYLIVFNSEKNVEFRIQISK